METGIINILYSVIDKAGIAPEIALLLFIIGMLVLGYKYIFKPMQEKINKMPSKKDVQDSIEKSIKLEELNLAEASRKLDKIYETLDNVEDLGKGNNRGISEIKGDVESIKQILVQFQGHMMYSRTNSDFGNRELR